MQPLADTFGELTGLEDLESVTSGRIEAEQKGIPGIAPDAMAKGFGYTYVNAAFSYPRLNGNRFNPKDWGAWYAAFEIQTSLEEAKYHLTRALEACGSFDNTTRYVELLADFDADFVDLRNSNPVPDCLNPDIRIGYPAGQRLADEIRKAGHNGIVYPSARHSDGTCLVSFWPGLIQNFTMGAKWEMVWNGSPTPTITQVA